MRFFRYLERNLFYFAGAAVILAIVGAILMDIGLVTPQVPADLAPGVAAPAPHLGFVEKDLLAPLYKAIKVLFGLDGYLFHWPDMKLPTQRIGYLLFEAGRLIGFCVYLRAMFTLLQASFVTLRTQRKIRRSIKEGDDVVAVHGDSAYAAALLQDLQRQGRSVTFSDKRLLPYLKGSYAGDPQELAVVLQAPNQVILFEEDREALEFYEKNAAAMPQDARVYVHLDEISPEGLVDEHVFPFSMAEVCAQRYWERHPLYPRDDAGDFAASLHAEAPREPVCRVMMVGDGDYAERLLEQALLTNIFDVAGGVRYDVLGDMGQWQMAHPSLGQALSVNADELHFHTGRWQEHRELLAQADRVILCGSGADNVRIAAELQVEPLRELHVRADYASSLRVLGRHQEGIGPERVEIFGTLEELCTSALVIQDRAHDSGRLRDIVYGLGSPRCNDCATFDFAGIERVPDDWNISDQHREWIRTQRMARVCQEGCGGIGACLDCPFFKREWHGYNGFLRRSNYATAAHDGQKFRLLRKLGIEVGYDTSVEQEARQYLGLPEQTRHALQEIEHIRWCRFHYLNGWTYAPGKRDKRLRTHPDLVPYAELQTDQSKDADAYLNLSLTIRSAEEQAELERIWLGEQ